LKINWLPIATAPGTDSGGTVIVRLTTADGITGLGEAGLRRSAGTGSFGGAGDFLAACATPLLDADPQNLNALCDLAQQLGSPADGAVVAARAALDIAAHDLVGHLRGCPVHSILGGAFRHDIALTSTIRLGDAPPTAGAKALRLSIATASGTPEPMAARQVQDLLKAVGSNVQVDLDAGQSFDNPALARRFIAQVFHTAFYTNVALRDPLPTADLAGYALLRDALLVPIVLETAVTSARAMATIVRMQAADRVVIGLDRVGGLREAMRILSLCEPAAIGAVAASAARTAIGMAAACHFAAAMHDTFAAELSDPFDADSAAGLAISNGRANVGTAPGLGVRLHDSVAGRLLAVL